LAGGTLDPAGFEGNRFLSDIFREVDEEVRREQLMKLWQRYGALIIAACVIVVAAVGGWRAYEWWEGKKAAEWGAVFQNATTLAAEGNNKDAEEAFAKVAADGTPSYRLLARFREAAEAARRDPQAAVATYDRLAADGSAGPVLQQLATLRAGMILVDSAPYSEIVQRLEPLTAPDKTFRHTARATLALAAWRAKDMTAMRRWTDMILADPDTPPGTRGQIQMLLALSESEKKS
jgi:hypothetical protein